MIVTIKTNGNKTRVRFNNLMEYAEWLACSNCNPSEVELEFSDEDTQSFMISEICKSQETMNYLAHVILNITNYIGYNDESVSKAYALAFQIYKYHTAITQKAISTRNHRYLKTAYAFAVMLNKYEVKFIEDFTKFILANTNSIEFSREFIHQWFNRYIGE